MADKKEKYLYLSANLRAREVKMLTNERAGRMLDAASFDEAAKLLCDCGYEDMSGFSAKEIDAALSKRRSEVFREVETSAPEKELVDLFRMKYDYHNAKALIKAEALGLDADYLMSDCARFSPELLAECVREERSVKLPSGLVHAITEAKSTLARTANPQLADFVLDRAYFAEFKKTAVELQSAFVTGYAELLIDTANLKSAVRTLRMGKSAEFLRSALIPEGGISTERLLSCASGDSLAALYVHTPLEQAASLGAQAVSGGRLTEFELAIDNAINKYLTRAKLVAFGEEPVTAFLASAEGEITAVRMILTGRLAGIAPEVIKERLRDLYA